MEHGREGNYGEGKGEEVGLRFERKQFRDRVRGLKVGETDARVRFVIFVVVRR